MTMDEYIAALCERLAVPIDDVDVNAVLDLAKDAAHHVQRPAAPITTFIAGYAAAVAGGGASAVDAAIDAAADLAGQWPTAAPEGAGTVPLDTGDTGAGTDSPTTTREAGTASGNGAGDDGTDDSGRAVEGNGSDGH